MVTVTTDCRRAGSVTLVETRVTNDGDEAVSVRLRSRLDGPTWPPRDGTLPASGWTEETWTSRVEPGRTVGVGFASPADPREKPVAVEEVARGSDADEEATPTATTLARTLRDPRPPRDGVVETVDEAGTVDETRSNETEPQPETQPRRDDPTDWLDDVAERVERLEALAGAETLPEATVAVADVDGLDGVRTLQSQSRTDRERLLALAARAERLAGRIELADVPVETLERLA